MRAILILLTLAIGLGPLCLVTPPVAAGGDQDKAKIRPITKTVEGKLQAMDPQKGLLTVKIGQNEAVKVRLAADTKIRIEGKAGSLKQLKTGDVLTVTYEIRQDGNVAKLVALNPPR